MARYGGEEFVITFPQTRAAQAAQLCEKLRAVIENHNWRAIHPTLRVTMSMGICSDTGLKSFEEMLRLADTRLYFAKENGRNRVYAGEEMSVDTALLDAVRA